MTDIRALLTPGRRKVAAWICLGLALLLLLVSSLTVWVKQQALNTDRWVDASARLLQDDEVRSVIATRLVDALFEQSNITRQVESILPPRLDSLAGPAVGLVRQAAITTADDMLATPTAEKIWERVNRATHMQLVALLENDDTGHLTATDEGEVVLDLGPLVAELGDQLGISARLRPGAGQVTIMQSDQLSAAQDGVKVIRVLSVLLVIAVLALLAAAIWLAEGFRNRMVLVIGASLVLIGLILLVARRLVGNAVVEALADESNHDAAWSVWIIGTQLLKDIAVGLISYGVIALAGAWLAGASRWATALRGRAAPLIRGRTPAVYGVVAVLFLLALMIPSVNGSRRLIGIVILAAIVAAGVEALRRQILREHPGPPAAGTPAEGA